LIVFTPKIAQIVITWIIAFRCNNSTLCGHGWHSFSFKCGMNEMKKVLLVVDDPNTVDYISKTIQNREYEIKAIGSNDRVLEIIQQNCPDIVLIDDLLDNTDCLYLSKLIQEKHRDKDIQVLFIFHDISKWLNRDASNCFDNTLVMPFTIDDFLLQVDNTSALHVSH